MYMFFYSHEQIWCEFNNASHYQIQYSCQCSHLLQSFLVLCSIFCTLELVVVKGLFPLLRPLQILKYNIYQTIKKAHRLKQWNYWSDFTKFIMFSIYSSGHCCLFYWVLIWQRAGPSRHLTNILRVRFRKSR